MRFVSRSLLVSALVASVLASATSACSTCREINPKEIPIYPNAQDVKQEEPILGGIEIYRWSFTTTDTPEKVWEFYREKMVVKWRGSDHSAPQSNEKDVMIEGCWFYYFKLMSSPIDGTKYHFTIEFSRQHYY